MAHESKAANTKGGARQPAEPTPGYLHRHGLGPLQLRARLGRIPWAEADALRRAQAALHLFVATVAELLKADAHAQRLTPGRYLARLLASNPGDETPLLALAAAQLEADGALAGLSARHHEQLAAAMQTVSAHARLLRDGDVPAARIAELTEAPLADLLPLAVRQLHGEGAGGVLKLLKFAAQGEPPRSELLRRLRLLSEVLRAASANPAHATLDVAALRTLPAAVRHALLFTPALRNAFLSAQTQAAARPPSPGFDSLFVDHALAELAHGRLAHVDLDALFLAPQTTALHARIVAALASGSGNLRCNVDAIERLIAGSRTPAFCLVACAAARAPHDVRRALTQLTAFPQKGVLGEALHRFANIAWRDALPDELPTALREDAKLCTALFSDCRRRLLLLLGEDAVSARLSAAALFRQFCAWLVWDAARHVPRTRARNSAAIGTDITAIANAFALHGSRLAADIDGHDLLALWRSGHDGESLASALAVALRAHNAARWEHGFFARLAEADAAVALALVEHRPSASEAAVLASLS